MLPHTGLFLLWKVALQMRIRRRLKPFITGKAQVFAGLSQNRVNAACKNTVIRKTRFIYLIGCCLADNMAAFLYAFPERIQYG